MPGDWYLHLLQAQKGDFAIINKRMSVYRRQENGIWYLSLKNWDSIFCKYGVQLLNFYFNVYKNITNNNEKYLFDIFIPKLSYISELLIKNKQIENISYTYKSFSDYMHLRDEYNDLNNQKEISELKRKYRKYIL